MCRARLCPAVLLAVVVAPAPAWSQELIFSSETDDDELLDGSAGFDFEEVIERLRDLEEAPPERSGDANGDGKVNVVDAVFLLNWIFRGGPEPGPLSCSLPPREALGGPEPLHGIAIRLELNQTNRDAEVTIAAGSGDGLRRLMVHDPSNRKIVDLRSPLELESGFEKIVLDSSDPTLDGVKKAYPEGAYLFQAVTTSGTHLAGAAELTHDLIPAPGFVHTVHGNRLIIEWAPVEEASKYQLELDQDELGFHLAVRLDPTMESFSVPLEFLAAGRSYDVSLGSLTDEGNATVAEGEITIPSGSAPVAGDGEDDTEDIAGE